MSRPTRHPPTAASPLAARAQALMRAGRDEAALHLLAQAPADDLAARHLRALLHLRRGHPAAAVEDLRVLSAARPDDPGLLTNLGVALRAAGQLEAAEAAMRRAVSLPPPLAQCVLNLATLLRASGRAGEGEAVLREGLARLPDHPRLLVELGRLLLDTGRPDEAELWLERAARQMPDDPEVAYQRGLAAYRRGLAETAVAHFEACLARAPDHTRAHLGLGVALQELGRIDAALDAYRTALARDRSLMPKVVKLLTTARTGRFWLRPSQMCRRLLGETEDPSRLNPS